ncbi:energy transducer TonB [Botryobacter ruber]|uniref:energy transducer TonB n=1 Tax=Botryobacter ruber TaxID=2171629 RepID=UPI0013E3DA9F|nr:energy transducer TonB [Botryobacter ruber]
MAAALLIALAQLPAIETVAQTAARSDSKTVALVGQKPRFSGGEQALYKFIKENLRHPDPEYTPVVQVTFSVGTDGSVQDVQAVKGVPEEFAKEAVRVVKLMDKMWEPGKQGDKPVVMKQHVSIYFENEKKRTAAITNSATPGTAAGSLKNTVAQGEEKPYTFAEKMPSFKGGEHEMFKYLAREMKYPQEAIQKGAEGQVFVSFIVGKDGSLRDIKILRGLGAGTDEEAIRVIQSMQGKWEPGMQNGKPVPVRYNLPIKFSLNKGAAPATTVFPPVKPADKLPVVANQHPHYKQGEASLHQALALQLKLPEHVSPEHLYANLVLKFVVEKDGSISDVRLEQTKVQKTIVPGSEFEYMDGNKIGLLNKAVLAQLAEAATTALKSTSGNWESGTRNGTKSKMEIELPVAYRGSLQPVVGSTSAPATEQAERKLLKNNPAYTGEKKEMLRFISQNIRYPEGAPDKGVVKVRITLNAAKELVHYHLLPSNVPAFDEEVARMMELVKGSRFTDPDKYDLLIGILTFSFQTKEAAATGTALEPADIYVVRQK